MSEYFKGWKKSPLHPVFLIATWFYSGLSPKAPGTCGSLAALPVAYVLIKNYGEFGLAMAIGAVMILGLWATERYLKETGTDDPGEVVIDEVAGQWIACMPIAAMTQEHGLSLGPFFLAFVAFRVFDIYKPWPVRFFDRRHDAFGVMMDDVAAGIMASVVLIGFYAYVL